MNSSPRNSRERRVHWVDNGEVMPEPLSRSYGPRRRRNDIARVQLLKEEAERNRRPSTAPAPSTLHEFNTLRRVSEHAPAAQWQAKRTAVQRNADRVTFKRATADQHAAAVREAEFRQEMVTRLCEVCDIKYAVRCEPKTDMRDFESILRILAKEVGVDVNIGADRDATPKHKPLSRRHVDIN